MDMPERKEISRRPLEDCGAKFLYKEIEDLSTTDFVDKPERALARAELHGNKFLSVVKSVFNSEQAVQTAQLSLQQTLPVIKTELRSQILALAKKPDLWLKFADRIITSVNFELAKTNRAWIVEKEQLAKDLEEIFLPYVESYLLPVLEKFFEMVNEAAKEPLPMPFVATFGESQPIQYAAKLHAFNSRKHIQELAVSDPAVKRAFQAVLCAENEAIITAREGDSDKAFEILKDAFRFLEMQLRKHQWAVPGARFAQFPEPDTWDKPHNEELQLLQVGLFAGIQTLREQSLLELLPRGAAGELRNYLAKAAKHKLFGEIRSENRRLGIEVPPDWSCEGKTRDEIRNLTEKDLRALAGREVLDYNLETDDGPISTLAQAGNRQAFTAWQETEVELQRKALITEKVQEFCSRVKLTPRLQLVADLFDKPNEEIALAYYKRFGKRLKPGAIRTAKFRLLQKLGKPKKS